MWSKLRTGVAVCLSVLAIFVFRFFQEPTITPSLVDYLVQAATEAVQTQDLIKLSIDLPHEDGVIMMLPGIYLWQEPTESEWLLLSAVAVVSYFGQKCNIFAFKHGEASLLASLDYVRLLWATLFGFLIFDQLPGVETWFGAVIVVAAAIFTIYREMRRKRSLTSNASGNEMD